jgi:hypothetical protein
MSYILALSDEFLYVACTTEFPLGGPATRLIRTTSPPYSADEQGRVSS